MIAVVGSQSHNQIGRAHQTESQCNRDEDSKSLYSTMMLLEINDTRAYKGRKKPSCLRHRIFEPKKI